MEITLDDIQKGQKDLIYSGFWRRFAAALIDGIILQVVSTVVQAALGMGSASFFNIGQNAGRGDFSGLSSTLFLMVIVSVVMNWLYAAFLESSEKQATIGKMALGIQVIDATTLGRVSFGQATARHFGKIISGLILLIGYLMMLWDDRSQTLHDKMAGTLIVKK